MTKVFVSDKNFATLPCVFITGAAADLSLSSHTYKVMIKDDKFEIVAAGMTAGAVDRGIITKAENDATIAILYEKIADPSFIGFYADYTISEGADLIETGE